MRVEGLGLRVLGLRVEGLGLRVLGLRVEGLGFRGLPFNGVFRLYTYIYIQGYRG